ncbi:hypothetical protein ACJMK2_001620 [Sinanodonta woodiana]|uniref:Uncharacterized protein n=1 Tax=Sinanodonta woodiana TaxID=1069815 RepID=A0ABD3XW56_SINWO
MEEQFVRITISNWKNMGLWVSMHQSNPLFKGSGCQCTSNVLMSITKASTKHWSQATFDNILIRGDLLYINVACLVGQQYILPDELPISGTLFQSDKETNPFHNLEQAITCLEILNYPFMKFCNKTPSYTIVDSHSREISGLSSPDGTAIMTTHPTMRHLVKFIRDLTLSLSLGDS